MTIEVEQIKLLLDAYDIEEEQYVCFKSKFLALIFLCKTFTNEEVKEFIKTDVIEYFTNHGITALDSIIKYKMLVKFCYENQYKLEELNQHIIEEINKNYLKCIETLKEPTKNAIYTLILNDYIDKNRKKSSGTYFLTGNLMNTDYLVKVYLKTQPSFKQLKEVYLKSRSDLLESENDRNELKDLLE